MDLKTLVSLTSTTVVTFLFASLPFAAQALTLQPIFYDSGNYNHYFSASTLTADTDKSAYCPGDTVTVSGTRPFTATCGNGNGTTVDMSINGYQLPDASNVTCPYTGVTFCTAYTEQTTQVCHDVCKGGKDPDTWSCDTQCSNVTTKVCNSGATASYSICNETDITNKLNANPSWYVLSIDENPLNYQYSFTLSQGVSPGTYQLPIHLWVTSPNPSDGVWLPVDSSISYTVNTPQQCQSAQNGCAIAPTNIPWGVGNRLQKGSAVQANDFNTLLTPIGQIWTSWNNLNPGTVSWANSGYDIPVTSGETINHTQINTVENAVNYLDAVCPNAPSIPNLQQKVTGNPILLSDFNNLRIAVEAFKAQPPKPSSADQITAFSLDARDGTISGNSISITVPYGTSVTSLTPTITISYGATVSPASGVAQNFSNPVSYKVTAQDGVTSQVYTVTVVVASAPTGGGGTNPPPSGGPVKNKL